MTQAPQGGKRIAFFGGSFDPPHIGHVAVASAAQQALQLDRILFAPVGLQPLKPTGPSANFEDRVAMTRLAIANQPTFEISLLDAPDTAKSTPSYTPNYTSDTLTKLRESLSPNAQLFLLLGADSFFTLCHWHRAAEIPFLANLIVASRPNASSAENSNPEMRELDNPSRYLPDNISTQPIPNLPNRYNLINLAGQKSQLTILPNLNYDISATQLRNQIQGRPGNEPALLDPAVLQYIQQHRLYQ
jgi:nicotinate-nucleotide adenylyltransferase